MRSGRAIAAVGFALALAVSVACRDEGPMTRAGENLDQKIDEIGDEVQGTEGAFASLGEKLDAAADDAREKLNAAQERAEND